MRNFIKGKPTLDQIYQGFRARKLNIPRQVFFDSWELYQKLSPAQRERNGSTRSPEWTLEFDYLNGRVLKPEPKIDKKVFGKKEKPEEDIK